MHRLSIPSAADHCPLSTLMSGEGDTTLRTVPAVRLLA